MPIPFHLSGGGKTNSDLNMSNTSSLVQGGDSVEISQDDPSKVFTELTEIGHGNFGAVYYVMKIVLIFEKYLQNKYSGSFVFESLT